MSQTMVDTYKTLTYDDWIEDDKNKSKVKKTGANGSITAYDEKENRAMYDAYVAEINAQHAKNAALDANAVARANTMRENAILEERAKEYAERRAKMNGTSSAGVSQTAMIDLMSQMAGARANAQASYDNQERTIIQDYQDAIYEAQRNANAVSADAGVQRAQENETIRQGKVTDIENALADYEAGNITYGKFTEIYEANKDALGEGDTALKNESEKVATTDLVAYSVKSSDNAIKTDELTIEKVNELLDVAGKGDDDEQDRWVNTVIGRIKNGQIENGSIIDFNYGIIDADKGNYFVYLNGKLYQTDLTYDQVDEMLSDKNSDNSATDSSPNGEMVLEINGKTVKFYRQDD